MKPSITSVCGLLLLLTVLSFFSQAFSATAAETAKLQKGGVVVKESPTPSSNKDALPVVSAQILIPKPPADVWKKVQQPEHLMEKEAKVKSIKVVSQAGNRKDLAYTVMMSKLLPTFQYTLRHQPTQPMKLSFWRLNGSFKDVKGSWLVTPYNNGKNSILTYNISIDPGPLVPRFLLQTALKSDLPNMMNNVKSVLLKP
ncbi:MAG: SRPBCC family protein [Vampirovibrionales bacterium]|nr:SRPBCC family protein [Vampirovibrionales bacterium]